MTALTPEVSSDRVTRLLPSVTSGIVVGFTDVIFAISMATLIFVGPLEDQLPRGIAMVLVTEAIMLIFTALFTSFPDMLGSIQENPVVILSVASASLIGVLNPGKELIATVIVLILMTTLLTGGVLVLLGSFHLGGLVRYIPYPVIGGFLAGTGWLLVQGSISSTADYSLTLETLSNLLSPDQLILWFPGVIFGLLLFLSARATQHFLVMPVSLIGGLLIFYIFLAMSGISVEQALARGLLLGEIGATSAWQPLALEELMQVNWSAIAGQALNIGSIVVLTAITLLLNTSGMELLTLNHVDLNRQLRTTGIINILSGLMGGVVGYPDLSLSVLNKRIGGRGRIVSLIAGGIAVGVLIAGSSIIAYIPKALLGGLLFFQGIEFLDEWVVQGRHKLERIDYGVVILILFIIATSGFLMGVGLGVIIMVVIFVINYSRLNIFHHILSGSETASHVKRNAYHRRVLAKMGQHIYILGLQNYLFFGTTNAVLEQILVRLGNSHEKPLRFLILDFQRVTGLDSSAVMSLTKVKFLAEAHNFVLILSHMTEDIQQKLEQNELTVDAQMLIFPDLDYALEYCEEDLLTQEQITLKHISATLASQLAEMGFKKDYTVRLKTYLEKLDLMPKDILIRQGDESADLYFIELGQVSLYLEVEDNKLIRLQTLGMGTIVGELGFYLNTKRSASVIVDSRTFAYRLTREAMQTMKTDDPELAIAFNEMMLNLVAERLVATDLEIVALHR